MVSYDQSATGMLWAPSDRNQDYEDGMAIEGLLILEHIGLNIGIYVCACLRV
jgi:hypothetical protein